MSDTIVKRLPYQVDLAEPIKKTYLETLFATEDNEAHRFDLSIYRDKAQIVLSSNASISAYFIRYNDNVTINLESNLSGNVASVTLKKACYNKSGQFALIIKALDGGVINTVFYAEGTIFTSKTNTILDDENIIPSLEELLAQIATMEEATNAANIATSSANTAATNAAMAAENADFATANANKAAYEADIAANAANEAAQKLESGTVANSEKLGGKDAGLYALKSDIPAGYKLVGTTLWSGTATTGAKIEFSDNIRNFDAITMKLGWQTSAPMILESGGTYINFNIIECNPANGRIQIHIGRLIEIASDGLSATVEHAAVNYIYVTGSGQNNSADDTIRNVIGYKIVKT